MSLVGTTLKGTTGHWEGLELLLFYLGGGVQKRKTASAFNTTNKVTTLPTVNIYSALGHKA